MMENVLYYSIMAHLDKNNILSNSQHGFHAKHSCESQILSTVGSLSKSLKNHKHTNVLILDFSKVVDTVPHQMLRLKLKHWVVVDGDASHKVQMLSGIPRGTVLALLIFILYINDIGENITSHIKLFADDCQQFTVSLTQ